MTSENTSPPTEYYVANAGDFVYLRQTRYKAQFAAGDEHPHDVCAIARNTDELRTMVTSLEGSIDWCIPKESQS
jgi:hypothetical protein